MCDELRKRSTSRIHAGGAMLNRRRLLAVSVPALVAVTQRTSPAEADVGDRPARIVVGFQPGGSLDMIARVLAEEMKAYAPMLIVENKPGAGGRIALEAIKISPSDGTVMILTPSSTLVLNPHIYKTLGYDPIRDF